MSLTRQLDDSTSPVRRHFEETYPHVGRVRFASSSAASSRLVVDGTDLTLTGVLRFAPGDQRVVPPAPGEGVRRYDLGVAGAAFDYRVRLLVSRPAPNTLVAASGARVLTRLVGARVDSSCWNDLVEEIVNAQVDSASAGLSDAADEQVARWCGLLAMYEQLYRAPEQHLTEHPLVLAGPDTSLETHLGLVDTRVVDDVMALTRLFIERQPELAGADPQRVVSNPTFDRSRDLGGADADLVVDGTLLELKTVQKASLSKITVWQVLGYLLADTSDRHKIRRVGWYFARHGYLWQLPVEELLSRLSGGDTDLTSARAAFASVVEPGSASHDDDPVPADSVPGRALVERTVSFFPGRSRRGRWHVTRAQIVGTEGWREPLGPVCGARLVLDLEADPLRPDVGAPWDDDERLCMTCMQYTRTAWGRLVNDGDLPPDMSARQPRAGVPDAP